MFAPSQNIRLDIEALSGILGSISIACWIVVFSPQIIENFRRSSADALSLIFIIVWLLGDVFNILGAVLQGVLPTMTILAVYYTFADIVLLGQCFYYRGFTFSDAPANSKVDAASVDEEASEDSPLLSRTDTAPRLAPHDDAHRRSSAQYVDGTHLSPATPLLSAPEAPATAHLKPTSTLQAVLFNTSALLLVCAVGVFGWWLSTRSQHPSSHSHKSHHHHHHHHNNNRQDAGSLDVHLDLWGQIFGYLCAALYLGSRIPQLLLNYRRKSTEGVSMLFFLFACMGNLTYVLSIFAYEPGCAREANVGTLMARNGGCGNGEWGREYGRYMLVNTSWLVGSAGTLVLDMGIFAQFWIYRGRGTGRIEEVGEN